jgi:hypothetical protein
MSQSVVDRLHGEMEDLISVLDAAGEISLRSTADDNFRKALLLAAASYFEHRMTEAVMGFIRECSLGNPLVEAFVHNKAVSRQYHTWFEWDEKNANRFYGLFGKAFRDHMKDRVRKNEELESSVEAFMEIGRERNRLVHQDFGTFSMEKTAQEIFRLYRRALPFVEAVPAVFREFCKLQRGNDEPASSPTKQ